MCMRLQDQWGRPELKKHKLTHVPWMRKMVGSWVTEQRARPPVPLHARSFVVFLARIGLLQQVDAALYSDYIRAAQAASNVDQ